MFQTNNKWLCTTCILIYKEFIRDLYISLSKCYVINYCTCKLYVYVVGVIIAFIAVYYFVKGLIIKMKNMKRKKYFTMLGKCVLYQLL